MSTRKGNVVKLDDMLDTAKESMHEIMRKNSEKYAQIEDPEGTADLVGKAAIMIQDMSAKRYLYHQITN
jgi:arginyl-tRNA synthetase